MIGEILGLLTPGGRRSLLLGIAGFVLYALTGVAMSLLMLKLLSDIIGGSASELPALWALLALCLLVKGGAALLADLQKHHAGFDVVLQLRRRIVQRLKSFSLGFYTNERLGEIGVVIHKDVDNMEMVVGHLWTRMTADFVVSLLLIVPLFFLDPLMGALTVSTLPVALLLLGLELGKGQRIEKENGNLLADMVSLFVEYVKGIPLLKAFSENETLDRELAESARRFGRCSERASKYRAGMLARYAFLLDMAFLAMAIGGIVRVRTGSLPLLSYLIFVIVGREFYKPFGAMEAHWLSYLKVTDSYARIKKVLDAPVVREPAQPKAPCSFGVSFDHVSFSYGKGEFSMRDISFTVPERTMTALVGGSGSGKTTAVHLLLRFWEPSSGAVRVGGVDIRDMRYDELLGSVSIVMQNVQLFADTIEENIRIGRDGASMDEVVEAARRARIHDFIMSLPEGYATPVGENGVGLSGGQKQRLSIARAFLKDAPILLLDEMTSNVDPINEALIQEAVSELARNRTVLVVAHHLSTVRSADQILVFRGGAIVQSGTHESLVADGEGYYAALWRKAPSLRGLSSCKTPS